jgi:tetratricopeptide (TPR) repeat protein/predicted aspartyl protease
MSSARLPHLLFTLLLAPGFLGLATAARGENKCQIGKAAEVPITMERLRPIVPVKFNGQDGRLLLDSGAFYSMLSVTSANDYHLKVHALPPGFYVSGVGGQASVGVTQVKEFTFVGVPIRNVEFLVGGSHSDDAGLLGQNILSSFDVEYDLAAGVIRLFRTKDCEHTRLAYWLKPGDPWSSMRIEPVDQGNPHTIGVAYLNGQRIRVVFDTGAFTSVLSRHAAERAGMTSTSAGVAPAGYSSGLGRSAVKTFIGTFGSFKIGDDEEIRNAKLRFMDEDLGFADMLLGADFFLSHRILVGNRERTLFLSYNGGAVFDLSKKADSPVEAANVPDQSGSAPLGNPDELARHGAALGARRDYAAGIAELSKAIAQKADPDFYYSRANLYRDSGQREAALADYGKVLELKPDSLGAYLQRAALEVRHDNSAALKDLKNLDERSARDADQRLQMARLYRELDDLPAAIEQLGLWIDNHEENAGMGAALSERCSNAALLGQNAAAALKDCNRALHLVDRKAPESTRVYTGHALANLRLGDAKHAAEDCDTALKLEPDNANAIYLRAVAEARLNRKQESDADAAAAQKLSEHVAAFFAKHGISR